MATTVGQHGVATFTTPSNGDALDANVVKGNDNTTRDAYVAHDSDSGIHIQSSLLAARPAAGTVGRKWMTTDTANVKLFYDNGSAWENLDYLPTAGNVAITGDLTVAGTTTLTGTVGLPSGTILTSPSLLGTMTGGTLTPSTLTVPSGTTIPTHTETGTITATGSTRNDGTLSGATLSGTTTNSGTISGGTMSGATLNNSTFTGTVTGLATTPSVYSASLASNVSLTYGVPTTIVSVAVPSAGTYLGVGQAYVTGMTQTSTGGSAGANVFVRETNTTLHGIGEMLFAASISSPTATINSTIVSHVTIPITFVAVVASATTFTMTVSPQGNSGSPACPGNATYDYNILSLIKIA